MPPINQKYLFIIGQTTTRKDVLKTNRQAKTINLRWDFKIHRKFVSYGFSTQKKQAFKRSFDAWDLHSLSVRFCSKDLELILCVWGSHKACWSLWKFSIGVWDVIFKGEQSKDKARIFQVLEYIINQTLVCNSRYFIWLTKSIQCTWWRASYSERVRRKIDWVHTSPLLQ